MDVLELPPQQDLGVAQDTSVPWKSSKPAAASSLGITNATSSFGQAVLQSTDTEHVVPFGGLVAATLLASCPTMRVSDWPRFEMTFSSANHDDTDSTMSGLHLDTC